MLSTNDPASYWERPPSPRDLSDWLIAHGRHWVTVLEVAELLNIPASHVPPTLARSRAKGQLLSPTRGAYVPIPPEYRMWGTVPASHFVDAWMKHLGHDYYVGLLSAAELHGAAHQHSQVFQVITDGRLRHRSFGRVRFEFIHSIDVGLRPHTSMNTPTGTMQVSTPEATVLDLVSHPRKSGGISNVATILTELLEEQRVEISTLASVSRAYPVAVRQRAGWLLAHLAEKHDVTVDLAPLAAVSDRKEPTALDPSGRRSGKFDERWNVIVNAEVEPDV